MIGHEIILIVALVIAAIYGFVWRWRKSQATTEPSGTTGNGGTIASIRRSMMYNIKPKGGALIGYGILLWIVSYSFPEFWKDWKGTGMLFVLAHILVMTLIFVPIWNSGHGFAKLTIGLAVAGLITGTASKMWRRDGNPSPAASATVEEAEPVDAGPIGGQNLVIKAPRSSWSKPLLIPSGYSFETEPHGAKGTNGIRIYFMQNEDPSYQYLRVWKHSGVELYRVISPGTSGERLEYIPDGKIPGATEIVQFRSGESKPVLIKVVLWPM